MKREANITRLDYERTHAWWVRFQRVIDGERRVYSRVFSDAKLGGKRKGLGEARKWRDTMLPYVAERSRPPPTPVPPGYGYVRRQPRMQRKSVTDCFVAWVRMKNGKSATTSRSIPRWGVKGARQSCEAWLERKRASLKGGRASPPSPSP